MICKQCKSEIADGSKYCNFCGAKVDESVNLGILRKKLAEIKIELSKTDKTMDKKSINKKIDVSLSVINSYLQNTKYADELNELLEIKEQFIKCKEITDTAEYVEVKSGDTNIVAKLFTLLGALGVISAAVAVFYINWSKIPDSLKGILVAVIGLVITSVGYQRATSKNDRFNQAITSCGIATMYIAIGMSTLGLQTIHNEFGALLCLVVSIGTMCIATKLNSQLVASFAVIGGYLPVFVIEAHDSISMRFWGVAELCTVSMMSAYCAVKNNWKTVKFVYYILSWCVAINATVWNSVGGSGTLTSSITYIVITGVINTLIPVIRSYICKKDIDKHEFVLEVINSILISICIIQCNESTAQYKTATALVITGVVYIASHFITRKFNKYSSVFNVLGATVITTLCIVYQAEYINLVWVLEVIALLIIGDKVGNRVYSDAASVILMVTYVTHGVCSDGYAEFWGTYGKFITEAIDVVIVTYLIREYRENGTENTSKLVQLAIGMSVVLSAIICIDLSSLVYSKAEAVPNIVEKYSISSSSVWASIVAAVCAVIERVKISKINMKDSRIICTTEIIAAICIGAAVGLKVICVAIGLEGPFVGNVKDAGAVGYVVCTAYLLLLMVHVIAYTSVLLTSISSLKHREGINNKVKVLTYFVIISMLVAFTTKSLYELESTVWVSLVLSIIGAGMVYKGASIKFKEMRVTGIVISSVSMLKSFIELCYVSSNLRPVAYLILALSCFTIGRAYMGVNKAD